MGEAFSYRKVQKAVEPARRDTPTMSMEPFGHAGLLRRSTGGAPASGRGATGLPTQGSQLGTTAWMLAHLARGASTAYSVQSRVEWGLIYRSTEIEIWIVWTHYEVKLSKDLTQKIIIILASVGAAGVVAAIASAMTGAGVPTSVAIVLAAGIALLSTIPLAMSDKCNGVIIDVPFLPGPGGIPQLPSVRPR